MGPLPQGLVPVIKTSPIGLVPEAHQPRKWRMIVDLSFPFDHTVNAGISEELSSARVNDAVVGIQNAYRNIPIHPHDHHLLGIL